MEDNLKGNNGKSKTIIMVLVMIMVIFLAGFIVFEKVTQKNKEDNDKKDVIELIDVDINSSLVKELMEKINYGEYENIVKYLPMLGEFYNLTNIKTISDMNIEYLVNNVIYNMQDTLIDMEDKKSFLETNFKVKYNEIYGSSTYQSIIDILKNTGIIGCPSVNYNEENNVFDVVYKCNYNTDEYITRNIVRAQQNDENLYIYEKALIIKIDNDNKKIILYNNKNIKIGELELNNIDADIETIIKSQNLSSYINKFDQYKYTFKKHNDNYYFYSIELFKQLDL